MLVALHWWPPDVEFDLKDLNTVAAVLKDQQRQRRGR
jgi:hypothetical protein